MGVPDASDSRLALLTRWVTEDLGIRRRAGSSRPPADASFRRYFRVTRGSGYLHRDGRAARQGTAGAVRRRRAIAEGHRLERAGRFWRATCAQGLLLLSDLGTRQYLDELWRRRATSIGSIADALGRARRNADPRPCGRERAAALRPRPADARNGADAGMVPAPPPGPSRRPPGALCSTGCSMSWCDPRSSSRRRTCTGIIIRAIFW